MKYALINGKILNGHQDMEVETGKTIFIENEKIVAIEPYRNLDKSYQIIDLQGKYILPGLINMHVHLAGNGKPQKKQKDNEKTVKMLMSNPLSRKITYKVVSNFAKIELMSGVTTIRTVGGIAHYDSKLRDEILKGKVVGPRIVASNEGISVPHGHMAGSVAIAAHNNEEALALVDKAKSQNVDLIKLMITGGVLDAKEKGVPGELKMPPEMVKAVCDKAHQLGYKVAAHVESSEGVRVALENGVDSIEHGAKLDDEMIALFKEKKAFLCTTISPALPFALFDPSISNVSEIEKYNGELVFNGIIDCAKQALENDIPVVLGNDVGCPWVSQYDFWRELYYFHKYIGVSNRFALYTATSLASKYAGLIILSALITFLLRAFPFLLFKEKELPKWLEKLEKHLPMTIMAVLIVYCLKDLKTQLTTLFIPYLLACLTVVFTYKWKKNTFLSIILSTLVYMIFIRL